MDTKNFLDKNGLSHLWDKIGDNFLDYTSLQTVINAIDEEKADIDSPEFIGTPTAPTTDLEDSSQKLATTEFVHNVVSSSTGGLVLDSIKIKNPPDKVDYKAGEVFSDAGMVITANYSNGYVVVIEDIVITGYNFDTSPLVAGTSSITINYTEGGISCSVVQLISVSKTSLSIPSQDGTLIYNGSTQTPLWNNYDSSKMTISGTTSSINAGIFNVIFTLKDTNLYEWSNGKTDPYQTSWTIAQVPGTVSLSPTSVAIDASNLTKTVSITRNNSSGTISWSPTTVSGLTFNLNGNTLSITGNGSTAISSQTITVSVSSSKNYTSASATFTVSATYWSWGDETASGAGDATWWSTLKSKVATMTTDELKACVGKTKSVTLSTAVLGTTTHLVRCIGYNLDRDVNNTSKNTLTFQTANALATTTVFGSSNAYWASSTAKTQCANYYTYFPGKDQIITVSKGTCTSTNSSQAGTPTYVNEQVFLPSDCEMGFPSGHDYSNGKGYAASYDEYCQQNTSKTAYQYYTSNDSRIKKQGDSGSAVYYWERSLYYNSTDYACLVSTDGKPHYNYYGYSRGLAPAFAI